MHVMYDNIVSLRGYEITDAADALAQVRMDRADDSMPSPDEFALEMGTLDVITAEGDKVNRVVVQIGATRELYDGLGRLEEVAKEELAVRGISKAARTKRRLASERLERLERVREKMAWFEEMLNNDEPNPLGVEITQTGQDLADEQLGGRTYDEVFALWETPGAITDPFVRQRAVSILTAISGYKFPYSAPGQSLVRLFYLGQSRTKGDTQTSGDALRDRLADRPDLSHELAQGTIYWLDKTRGRLSDRYDNRADYQALIRQLLPIVDDATGDRLFKFFQVRDVEPFYKSDFVSGYRPLELLVADREMPLRYKEEALKAWCRVAEQEESRRSEPRARHERATDQMSEILQILSYSYENDPESYDAVIRAIEDNLRPNILYVSDVLDGSYIGVASVADSIGDVGLRNRFLRRHGRPPATATQPEIPAGSTTEANVIVGQVAEDGEVSLSLNVQTEYFEAIKAGHKIIEGRLARTKYSNLRPGNRITITDDSTGEQLVMEVESSHIYRGFGAAFSDREDFREAIPDAVSAEQAVAVYEQFYAIDKQAAEGIIFLELKPTSK